MPSFAENRAMEHIFPHKVCMDCIGSKDLQEGTREIKCQTCNSD